MSNVVEVKVPDIGDFENVEVIEVLISEGDTIEAEQSLITVESDKASMEIPASASGKVKSLKVKVGDKVHEGSVILELESAQAQKPADKKEAENAPKADPDEPKADSASDSNTAGSGQQEREPAPQASSGTSRSATVVIPDIGDFDEVEVIEVLVNEGDSVEAEQSLITVESDKASMEIPSSESGTVKSLKVKVGDKVSKGTEILELAVTGSGGAKSSEAPAKASEASSNEESKPVEQDEKPEPRGEASAEESGQTRRVSPTQAFEEDKRPLRDLPHASPSVRKFARELGVNLAQVKGSGPKSRILADDVRQFVKQAVAGTGAGTGVASGAGFRCWPGRRWTLPNSGRWKVNLYRASRSYRALTCIATGS